MTELDLYAIVHNVGLLLPGDELSAGMLNEQGNGIVYVRTSDDNTALRGKFRRCGAKVLSITPRDDRGFTRILFADDLMEVEA